MNPSRPPGLVQVNVCCYLAQDIMPSLGQTIALAVLFALPWPFAPDRSSPPSAHLCTCNCECAVPEAASDTGSAGWGTGILLAGITAGAVTGFILGGLFVAVLVGLVGHRPVEGLQPPERQQPRAEPVRIARGAVPLFIR
jgi:hypothetical protein